MFEAEFCAPEHKHAREQARDALLNATAGRTHLPVERLKLAVLSGRYLAYRRRRLARELPSVPPPLRGE